MRVYNGCPEPALQRQLDATVALAKQVKEIEPEACCTYYPVECRYVVHIWGEDLTGFQLTRHAAWADALKRIEKETL